MQKCFQNLTLKQDLTTRNPPRRKIRNNILHPISPLPIDNHALWYQKCPSQFQKIMVTLFQPLLVNALIYVDDILLFSKDADSHEKLFTKFYNLVKSQEIILSEKNMVIRQSSIEFLRVNISSVPNRYNSFLELLITCLTSSQRSLNTEAK